MQEWDDRVAAARLTTQAWDITRNAIIPFVLNLPTDRPLNSSQRTSVQVFSASVAGQSWQLEALAESMEEIIAMIEAALKR